MTEEKLFEIGLKLFIRKESNLLVMVASNTRSGDFPGGRLSYSDSLFDLESSLRRELSEELGRRVNLVIQKKPLFYFPYTSKGGVQEVLGLGLVGQFVGGEIELSEEHLSFDWVNPHEALGLFDGHFRTGLEMYLERGAPEVEGESYRIYPKG